MDRQLEINGWKDQWISRTFPALHCETLGVSYLITVTTLIISINALRDVRKTRKQIEQSPSDRAAIFTRGEKRMSFAMRKQYYLALVFLFHAVVIWAIDAAIGVSIIYNDASENPEVYTKGFLLDLLFYSVSSVVLFAAVFLFFPLLQFVGISHLVGRVTPRSGVDFTFGTYISGARILTTQLAYIWIFIGFAFVAWWPVLEHSTCRILALEAAFGSSFAWLQAASMLHFRSEELANINLHSVCGVKDGMMLYGKHAYAVAFEKSKQDVLPKYEVVGQSEQVADEKTGQ